MTTEDSEYEQLRARLHEAQCRLAATMFFVRQRFCHRRACRRDRFCTGAMLVSPHQDGVVKLQKELGLSGKANACLPACIAFQPAHMVGLFNTVRNHVSEMQKHTSNGQILLAGRLETAGRETLDIYAHLTSPPYHPTSVAKETASKTADEKGMTP